MLTAEALRAKWDFFVIPRDKFIELRKKAEEDESIKTSEEYLELKKIYEKLRNEFLVMYYPIVSKVATRMSKKITEVEHDDLVSWGTDGLYHSIDRFIPSLENKFETYALPRIKGAILDNIRQMDWVPRLVRQRHSKIQKARHLLECKLGRAPTNEEMASHLNIDLEEYLEIASKSTPVSCVSIQSGTGSNDKENTNDFMQLQSFAVEEKGSTNGVVREEMFKKLMSRNFTPLERKVVHMHYYENLTMKEISDITGYSESRISQMHSKILGRLQEKVARNPEYMNGLEAIL